MWEKIKKYGHLYGVKVILAIMVAGTVFTVFDYGLGEAKEGETTVISKTFNPAYVTRHNGETTIFEEEYIITTELGGDYSVSSDLYNGVDVNDKVMIGYTVGKWSGTNFTTSLAMKPTESLTEPIEEDYNWQ